MTKPTDLVRFAVNGSDVNATNISAPSSATRDTGFPTNTVLTSANLNYFLNGYYRWLQYLNAGAFSGASSFDSTLGVTGVLTAGTDAVLSGNTTVGGQLFTFSGFTFTAVGGGSTVLNATAHPLHTGAGPIRTTTTGTLPSGLAVATDYFAINLSANTFSLATSRANALAGIGITCSTTGSGTHTVVSQAGTTRVSDVTVTRNLLLTGIIPASKAALKVDTTGKVSAGNDILTFNIALAALASGASINNIGGFGGLALGTSNQINSLPLILPVGITISAWQVQLQKSSASGTISAILWDINGLTGTGTQVGSTQSNSANNPGNIQLGQSGLSTVVTVGHSYQITVQGGGVTGDFVIGYSVTPA